VASEKRTLAATTLERLGKAVRLALADMLRLAQGQEVAAGAKQQKAKAKGAGPAAAAPPLPHGGGSLTTRQAAIKLLEALNAYCPDFTTAPQQLVLFCRDQLELLVTKVSRGHHRDWRWVGVDRIRMIIKIGVLFRSPGALRDVTAAYGEAWDSMPARPQHMFSLVATCRLPMA
jgi:hypothetical protein